MATKIVLKCPSCGHMIDFGKNWVPVDISAPMTQADRIRQMSDETMALWFAKWTDCAECPSKAAFPQCAVSEESCACQWHEWLKSTVENENEVEEHG